VAHAQCDQRPRAAADDRDGGQALRLGRPSCRSGPGTPSGEPGRPEHGGKRHIREPPAGLAGPGEPQNSRRPRPGLAPVAPPMHTGPVRPGPVCMVVATCTLLCSGCHNHALAAGPPGGGWGRRGRRGACERAAPARPGATVLRALESPVGSQYPGFTCWQVRVRIRRAAILPAQHPTASIGCGCDDPSAPDPPRNRTHRGTGPTVFGAARAPLTSTLGALGA
jgi:hypothetical protein